MYIKSIELQGFKSYRGKTTLRFSPGACPRSRAQVSWAPSGAGRARFPRALCRRALLHSRPGRRARQAST